MSLVAEIREALLAARAHTLRLFDDIDDEDFRRQAHPDFSPLGWHLGHIGVTESFWILQQCKHAPTLSKAYDYFFTPTDNPKPNRIHLPPRAEILSYLEAVRAQVLSYVGTIDCTENHPLLKEGGIFHMLLQHEEQHNETIQIIRQLLNAARVAPEPWTWSPGTSLPVLDSIPPSGENNDLRRMESIPAGSFFMGSDDQARTLDNERPRHAVSVAAFAIDLTPVSNGDFLRFMEAGGYHNAEWWDAEGWSWRARQAIACPLYWRQLSDGSWIELGPTGVTLLNRQQPVCGVSWYEAAAYSRFVDKRLPTEAEWEKAASLGVLQGLGRVWEWTSTWFTPYPGFRAHPYDGYSVPYFDGQHRVLRGGSWATRPHVIRTTFRNWYLPQVREIFAGIRCAHSL